MKLSTVLKESKNDYYCNCFKKNISDIKKHGKVSGQ